MSDQTDKWVRVPAIPGMWVQRDTSHVYFDTSTGKGDAMTDQITADEEREALAWLEWQVKHGILSGYANVPARARTLQRLLARPVMPERYSEPAIAVMVAAVACMPNLRGRGLAECQYNALYAHLAKPQKLKPVFHLEGSVNPKLGHPTSTSITADWHDINQAITALCNDGYLVVTVRREMVPE